MDRLSRLDFKNIILVFHFWWLKFRIIIINLHSLKFINRKILEISISGQKKLVKML